MKPSLLQRLIFILLVIASLVLGVFVAGAFLILGLLLIPFVALRLYMQRKALKNIWKAQRQQQAKSHTNPSGPSARGKGRIIEGEVVDKKDAD